MTVGGEERSAVAQFQPEIGMNGEGRWAGGGGNGRGGPGSLL